MTHDEFDVYKIAIEDTNEINRRRQSTDTLYTTILTLVLTGDVYLATLSQFDNWLLVAASVGIGVVGRTIVRRWRQAQQELDEILSGRYAFLRDLEASPRLSNIGATFITQEYKNVYERRSEKGFKSATRKLQSIFTVTLFVIAGVLALLTFLYTNPFLDQSLPWLVQWIHLFVRPIAPLPSATP